MRQNARPLCSLYNNNNNNNNNNTNNNNNNNNNNNTMYKMHQPKADTDRLYVKRKGKGTGQVQIEVAYKAEIINIAECLNTNYKEDQCVNIVKSYENTRPNMNSIIKTAAKITGELNQTNEKSDAKQDGIQHTGARLGESLKKWKNKVMHWQYIRNIYRQLISEEDAFL